MSIMDKLITEIRECLDRGEITMAGLARASGCTRQHLYAVLENKHKLSLEKAEKLAKAVGLELVCKRQREKISA